MWCEKHGELMFHQSGGCCDNNAANCYLPTDLMIGAYEMLLGYIGAVPFFIGKSQYEYWKHTQLIIEGIDGHGGTLSRNLIKKAGMKKSGFFIAHVQNKKQCHPNLCEHLHMGAHYNSDTSQP